MHGGEPSPGMPEAEGDNVRRLARRERARKADVMAELTFRPYRNEDAAAWRAHLANSNNGTLFHDLDFLAYHRVGKFDFRHLVATRDERIEAVIPGALLADGVFASPVGASVGGPAVAKSLRANAALELIEAMQIYASAQGWRGLEVTLPPPIYQDQPNQLLEFALHAKGFQLAHRAMPLLVPLYDTKDERYQRLFTQRRRSYVRACRRKGVVVREAGLDAAADFLELFDETYARHGQDATHTPGEIEDLLRRLPDRIRIWLAMLDEVTIAGVLLFVLNRNVCCTFYICDRASHRQYQGSSVLFADMIDDLANRNFRYLDLGPSASSKHFNYGVVHFKEGLGALAFCRDRWRWEVQSNAEENAMSPPATTRAESD
jgi:hypothetical protein